MDSNPQHFFVPGAAKAGSTTFYTHLDQHPNICMSHPKEPVFFELDRKYNKGKAFYENNFFPKYSGETYKGEARPINAIFPWIAGRITEMFPEGKFIFTVRNPVDRAYSFYWGSRRSGIEGTEENDFNTAIFNNYIRLQTGHTWDKDHMKEWYQNDWEPKGDGIFKTYLEGGYYYQQIKRFMNKTSPNQVKVILFQDLIEDPLNVCNNIFDFLGLKRLEKLNTSHRMKGYTHRFDWLQKAYVRLRKLTQSLNIYDMIPHRLKDELQKLNIGSRSKPPLEPLTRLWLHQHYKPHNQKMRKHLDRDLKHWEFPLEEYSSEPVINDAELQNLLND